MAARALLALLGLALTLPACRRGPRACGPEQAALFELRDGTGALEVAARSPIPTATAGELDLCDARGERVGRLAESVSPRAVVVSNPAGDPIARLSSAMTPGENPTLVLGADGRPGRLHDEDGLLRVLDADGVPLGQIGRQAGKTVAFDRAGSPVATAELVERRQVVRTLDGAVRLYAVGFTRERAAAALALDRLAPLGRLAIARFLDEPAPPR